MKIGIVGGGSIGLLFTYYLNLYHDVVLYVRNACQLEELQRNGLVLQNQSVEKRTFVKTMHVSEWGKTKEDLSIICVKQYHLQELLMNVKIPPNQPLLFIQNGMGHLKIIEGLTNKQIFIGSVEHGALRVSENKVIKTGKGLTKLSVFRGEEPELLKKMTDPVNEYFPFQFVNDYKEMLLRKLVANAIINPLTAVLKVKNGCLLENPHYFLIFKQLFQEINSVLHLENAETFFENAVSVCKNTAENKSSMLKDIEENRKTEVDAILGYIIEEAEMEQKEAPLINALYHCIKGSEFDGEEI